jgi:protein ImuB
MLGFAVPCRDAERMLRLLRERLANFTVPDRVEAIAIESRETRPLDSRNLSLFPEDRLLEEQRWLIIEHLRARLGSAAVHGITSHSDHRPEQAWRACEPGTDVAASAPSTRPLWLLQAPRRLPVEKEEARSDAPLALFLSCAVQGDPGPLTVLAGPERIESGWWDDGDTARDYFVAVDTAGRKLWVFRERQGEKQWYLHGLFG